MQQEPNRKTAAFAVVRLAAAILFLFAVGAVMVKVAWLLLSWLFGV